MSLYSKYIKELKGFETIEDVDGFITYEFLEEGNEKWCYIEELYVVPEKRKSGKVVEFADAVSKIAIENGCNKLLGSIVPSLPGAHRRMEVLMSYNFKLYSSQDNLIYLIKELK